MVAVGQQDDQGGDGIGVERGEADGGDEHGEHQQHAAHDGRRFLLAVIEIRGGVQRLQQGDEAGHEQEYEQGGEQGGRARAEEAVLERAGCRSVEKRSESMGYPSEVGGCGGS